MEKRTSAEWRDLVKKKIYLEIIGFPGPEGWDLKNWNFSFHNEPITLQEFKKRLINSTIECKPIEFNEWLNSNTTKAKPVK